MIVLIVDYYHVPFEKHQYSLYIDGNLEMESIDETITHELLQSFEVVETPRSITIEDGNQGFSCEAFSMMPERSSELFATLGKVARKVSKGVWCVDLELE